MDVLVSGGIAGIITWASIYPLDVIKTRIQAEAWNVGQADRPRSTTSGASTVARTILTQVGVKGLYRGLMVCSVRAFFVNAIQVLLVYALVTSVMLTSSSGIHTKRSWHCSHPRRVAKVPPPQERQMPFLIYKATLLLQN